MLRPNPEETGMKCKRHGSEEIINKLRTKNHMARSDLQGGHQ